MQARPVLEERAVPRRPLNDAEVMSTKAPVVLPLLLAFVIFLAVGAGYQHFPKSVQNISTAAADVTATEVASHLSLYPD